MRVFWAFVAILILAGVGALALSGTQASRAKQQLNEAQAQAETAREHARAEAENARIAAERAKAEVKPEIKSEAKAEVKPDLAAKPKEKVAAPALASTPPVAGTKAPATAPTKEPAIAGTHAPGHQPQKPVAPARPEPKEEPPADPNATMPDGVPAKLGEYDVRPVRIEKKDDGSVMLDGRFTLRGTGTKEDPYRVPWELLVSAKDTFEPAAGLKKIPGRVAMLHDKFVRLDGYVAFPLMMQKPTELLSMLNQWDGCCIGVPPSPYDAVEVKLAKMVTGDARFAVTGSVVGKFKVDPYVVKNPRGDWLVGMYTMSVGDFTPEDIGDNAGS
jgi:type II secretory pathway pseudopilin PulG